MRYAEGRIIVFAKAPVPGKVKTRLTGKLSAQQAAALHQQLVSRTLDMVTQSGLADVELWCAPDESHPFFQQCRQRFPIALFKQRGDDLGERMFNAMSDSLTRADYCLIVGTDCPQLTPHHLEEALQQLKAGRDCIITPALDGGYVMLGLRRIDPRLFSGIRWGGDSVFSSTIERLKQLGWQWRQQTPLADIDRPEDIHLLDHIELPPLLVKP